MLISDDPRDWGVKIEASKIATKKPSSSRGLGSFGAYFSNPKLGARMSDFPLAASGVRVFQDRLFIEKFLITGILFLLLSNNLNFF
jgi:hypothetical protein